MRREFTLWLLAGCVEPSAMGSTVDAPRILTVLADPPEAAPGERVHLEAVVAGVPGPLSWSMCSTPRSALDNTAVSAACARYAEEPSLGDSLTLDALIPADACRTFGSETPAGTMPNAPDATGGYYQPVRIAHGEAITVARVRIQCPLAAAPIELVRAYNTQYERNLAPILSEPRASRHGDAITLSVELDPPESYLHYHDGTLEPAVEQQTVSWFVSAGYVTPGEAHGTSAEAVWTLAPDVESAQLWIIARDDRGATSSRTLQLQGLSFLRRPSTTGTILPSIGAY